MSLAAKAPQTAGGVYLPPADDSKSKTGAVAAVGPGIQKEDGDYVPLNVKVGDEVLLPEYGGAKVEVEGEECMLFRESDILGTFK